MTDKPTPRNLDPKFSKAMIPTESNRETETVTKDDTVVENRVENRVEDSELVRTDSQGRVDTEVPSHADNEVSQITHIQRFTGQDGKPAEVVHGPMPVSEWTAYEKENGL